MRNAVIALLLIVTVGSTYWFWLTPKTTVQKAIIMHETPRYNIPKSESPDKSLPRYDMPEKRIPVPPSPEPEKKYDKAKKEIKDWLDIGGKAIPVVSFLGVLWVRKKGKKKR